MNDGLSAFLAALLMVSPLVLVGGLWLLWGVRTPYFRRWPSRSLILFDGKFKANYRRNLKDKPRLILGLGLIAATAGAIVAGLLTMQ